MAKRKPDYHAKYKLWLPRMTLEGSGGAIGCISLMFSYLPREMREATLARLTAEHAQRSKQETDAADRLERSKTDEQ